MYSIATLEKQRVQPSQGVNVLDSEVNKRKDLYNLDMQMYSSCNTSICIDHKIQGHINDFTAKVHL